MIGLLRRQAGRAATAMTAGAAVALVLATLHILADTIATQFFRSPLPGTFIVVTHYYMVALFFLPLARAELKGAHISADLLSGLLPAPARKALAAINLALVAGFTAVLAWQAWAKALSMTRRGEIQMLDGVAWLIWPSRWIAVLGLAAMSLAALLRLAELLLSRSEDGEPQP